MNDASKVRARVYIFNCHVINSVSKQCCAKKSFEIQFSGTEETLLSPCTINVCLILHVSLPVLASACCVPALPFGMSNMPPTRILWNETTSHCRNAVWRDCVLLPVSQHVLDCTVQIRVQISLLRPSCAQDEGHMTFCPHFLCCSVLLFFLFSSSWLPSLFFIFVHRSTRLFFSNSVFQSSSKHEIFSTQHRGRHLLDFASETETEAAMGPDPLSSGPSEIGDR